MRYFYAMEKSHFERMMELVTEVFDTKNDPEQLDVDREIIERLQELHPATLSEYDEGKGPACWILLIPTTTEVMNMFIGREISERQLYEQTLKGGAYEAVYLCSASTLPEYRGKGIAKKLTMDAIREMQKDFEIKALYVWPFSEGGDVLAARVAHEMNLPLYKRTD